MSKLHLVTRLAFRVHDGFTLFARCGLSPGDKSWMEEFCFTNDISTMESLPSTKVCQNCMKAYRAQREKEVR